MDAIELSAEPRSVIGKQVKALRRQGVLPANIYGGGESTPIQLATRPAQQVLARAGKTHLIRLNLLGQPATNVLVKDYQRHPTRGDLLHVDFYRVAMDQKLSVDVPVRLHGDAPATKAFDGTVFQQLATVSVEALPSQLPEAIDVDISGLEDLDSTIHVRDLPAPDGATILTDGDELVVKILPPTVEPEVTEPEDVAAEAPAAGATGETAEGEGTTGS
ncbi:MAG: 50S ribosomal protein L25 [Chloroflexota bacterium]|nr:50S ribosomal protein L25 [Chloroflexota bacterium]